MKMTEKKKDPARVVSPVGRVSFPKVYKAEAFEDQQPKFSCSLLLKKKADTQKDDEGLKLLRRALHAAKVKQWGDDPKKWPKGLLNPISDGDEKEDLDGYPGHWVVAASNKHRPEVVDGNLEPIPEETDEFYAGCFARMALRAYAWEFKSQKGTVLKRGVSFSLESIQKHAEGERFSGRQKAEDVFERVEKEESDSNEEDEDGGF
jgi:hypothetical protein